MSYQLRQYQLDARDKAIAVIRHGGGFGLWPEPRVGKTVISLSIIEQIRPEAVFVACPKAAISVWNDHWKESGLSKLGIKFQVLNFDQISIQRKELYKLLRQYSRLMALCDESHQIKRRGTDRSRVVRHIGGFAKYRLALSGTPIAQGIQDAWAQFDFIDPTIFGTWEEFDNAHLIWGGFKKHQIVKYRDKEEFNRKFHQYSYRITLREAKKENGGSLRLHYVKKYVQLESPSARIYTVMRTELQAVVNDKKIKVKNVLSCIMKLQQITGGFLITPGEVLRVGQEKFEKLYEVIRSLRARSKFIVIARFIHEIDAIRAYLSKLQYTVKVVRGGEPYDGQFECDAIVMQIQSGIAVDMSKADMICFYSCDYSYINFEQSRFRILSYGKSYGKYTFLLARDTIDETIYEAITQKKNLAKLVIDTYRGK